jgi:hypothetical protein
MVSIVRQCNPAPAAIQCNLCWKESATKMHKGIGLNRQDAKKTKKETDEERTADDADGRRWRGNHGIHGIHGKGMRGLTEKRTTD